MCEQYFFLLILNFHFPQDHTPCVITSTTANDILDNDCDGLIDEEIDNGIGKYM